MGIRLQIELLYFDSCPSYQVGLENLKAALALEGLEAEIRLVQVEDNPAAEALRFLGSPSFHVNGIELWPEQRDTYALSCRVYITPKGMRGAPTVEMLQERLRTFATL